MVDEFGRVYDDAGGALTDIHEGLYAVDGSVMPRALGPNPTLTISAQALKTVTALT